jgi:hypothetical protein
MHRALADERFLGAVLPRLAPILRRVFAWRV